MMHLASHENFINLNGPLGNLEGILALPTKESIQKIAVICHPHPLQGGTMHNKVVTTISRVFSELGIVNVRFNFRGVGTSAGQYGNTIGETEDLLTVMQWLQDSYPQQPIWLAGFSFGSYITARAASLLSSASPLTTKDFHKENKLSPHSVELLLSVAPPVNHFDFVNLTINCPWIVVQGDEDEVVPAKEVYTWAAAVNNTIQVIRMPTTGHFFHGHLTALKQQLLSTLNNYAHSHSN